MTSLEVKRKLAAILSADVKGYSRLMGEDEEGTLRTLTAYREVMAGSSNNTTVGWSMLLEMPYWQSLKAWWMQLNLLLRFNVSLLNRNGDLPTDRRMEYRIGINLGDVMVDGDSILWGWS